MRTVKSMKRGEHKKKDEGGYCTVISLSSHHTVLTTHSMQASVVQHDFFLERMKSEYSLLSSMYTHIL